MRTASEIFGDLSHKQAFQHVGSDHPLDLYCGLDEGGRNSLLLVCRDDPPNLVSSKVIEVKIGRREDGRWALTFSLVDDGFRDIFLRFCDDMITASAVLEDSSRGGRFVARRYDEWQEMLAAVRKDILARQEIKGLMGELLFLKNVLMPHYGNKMAIQSWVGPENNPKDFIFPDTWYEVKSARSGAEEVNISSIEQLDSGNEGMLAVLALDPTSRTDRQGITLNQLYKEFSTILGPDELKLLDLLLAKTGYVVREEYDEFSWRFNGMRLYRVDRDFPCLKRGQIPDAVVSASWTLSLAAVSNWLKEGI